MIIPKVENQTTVVNSQNKTTTTHTHTRCVQCGGLDLCSPEVEKKPPLIKCNKIKQTHTERQILIAVPINPTVEMSRQRWDHTPLRKSVC